MDPSTTGTGGRRARDVPPCVGGARSTRIGGRAGRARVRRRAAVRNTGGARSTRRNVCSAPVSRRASPGSRLWRSRAGARDNRSVRRSIGRRRVLLRGIKAEVGAAGWREIRWHRRICSSVNTHHADDVGCAARTRSATETPSATSARDPRTGRGGRIDCARAVTRNRHSSVLASATDIVVRRNIGTARLDARAQELPTCPLRLPFTEQHRDHVRLGALWLFATSQPAPAIGRHQLLDPVRGAFHQSLCDRVGWRSREQRKLHCIEVLL